MDKSDDAVLKDLVREIQDERDHYMKKWLAANDALADELKHGGRLVKFFFALTVVCSIMWSVAQAGWRAEAREHLADRVWCQDRVIKHLRACDQRCVQGGILP